MNVNIIKQFILLISVISFFVACTQSKNNPVEPKSNELPNKLYEVEKSFIENVTHIPEIMQFLKYDVSVYLFEYKSTINGKIYTLSGTISVPKDLSNPPILIDCHGTIQSDLDAPSNSVKERPQRFVQIASSGYIVFAPDYLGFGSAVDEFHPWLVSAAGERAIVDFIIAGKNHMISNSISFTDKVFIIGYSEGANFTLAAQKEIESNSNLGINIIASAPGSGAYDMSYTFERRINGNDPAEAIGDAYLIVSMGKYYSWNKPITYFLNEPYASGLQDIINIPGSFEDNFFGTNNQLLEDFIAGTLNQDTLLTDNFKNDFNTNNQNILELKLAENDLTNWKPTTPTTLFYGGDDTTTYFQNSLRAYDSFIAAGADPNIIKIVSLQGKNHETAEGPWVKLVLEWFDQYNN